MPDVFISYKREERAYAKVLAELLARRGVEVWWDVDLLPGDQFADAIAAIISQVKVAVVLWSTRSVKSDHVRSEANRARLRNMIFPARLEDCDLPIPFDIFHTHDLSGWDGSPTEPRVVELADAVANRVAPAGAPAETAPQVQARLHAPDAEAVFWRSITESKDPSPEEYRAYLSRFGEQGLFADLARLRIARLGGERGSIDRAAAGRAEPSAPTAPSTSPATGRQPLSVFRDVEAPWCPELVVIPAGRFVMGSPPEEAGRVENEGPQHQVMVPRFALGRYAVTFEEYDHFCAATGRDRPEDLGWGRDRRPVINVSWHDAQAYVRWLSEATGAVYRLPSEAEWEYGCRAGTETPFSTGRTISVEQATMTATTTYGSGVKGLYRERTEPVGRFGANPWGLHEMHGNVWEWVEDCWHEGYEGAPADGSAWLEGQGGDCSRRVLRGGSWLNVSENLRSANRVRNDPDVRSYVVGFRVARTLTP